MKVDKCVCFFSRRGFHKGFDYVVQTLDKGTVKIWYDYSEEKDDYEVMSVREFHAMFKRLRDDAK